MKLKSILVPVSVLAPLALIAWGGLRYYKTGSVVHTVPDVPVTTVKKSDVTFTVSAKAELQGGKSEMLSAPMMGGSQLILTGAERFGRPGERRRRGGSVRHHRTGVQAEGGGSRSGRSRAAGDSGASGQPGQG